MDNSETTPKDFSSTSSTEVVSKRSLKRLQKEMRLNAVKEELMERRRIKNRERRKRNKGSRKAIRSTKEFTGPHVVIDFSFSDLMMIKAANTFFLKDLMRCLNQSMRCYASNRRVENGFKLSFTSFNGEIVEIAKKHDGYGNWSIDIKEENYLDNFDRTTIIYLTSESDNVLEKIEQDKVYVIGGFVDHNAHKGLSYKRAVDAKIQHARLPIKENVAIQSRTVLAINHVFDILLNVYNGSSWEEAIKKSVPNRAFFPRILKHKKKFENNVSTIVPIDKIKNVTSADEMIN